MRYQLDDISAFLHAVETGSVSAAAQRMGLSKSVVSDRVADLEFMLKVELLRRSTRGVVPTEKGSNFYQHARSIMEHLDQTAEELADQGGELRGSLRIAAPASFGTSYLNAMLFSFFAQHPQLGFALDFDDRFVDLAGEGYDLAIRIGRLPDSSLVARKLTMSRRILCCSPEYAKRIGLPAAIKKLASMHACIGYANAPSNHIWEFEPAIPGGERRSLTIRSNLVANSGEAMRDAAIAGLGITILPLFIVARAMKDGQLINALPSAEPAADPVCVDYPQNRYLSKKVRMLIEHLVNAFGDIPPWERELGDVARTSPKKKD
ncbi:MAG: LysR family transcriptional regulator [Noviherbaspirillum sp.]